MMSDHTELAAELAARADVRHATADWGGCDVSVLVPDGTDIAPIREGFRVVEINDFDAAPYVLLNLDVDPRAA